MSESGHSNSGGNNNNNANVFLRLGLEQIEKSKDAKKIVGLNDAVACALAIIDKTKNRKIGNNDVANTANISSSATSASADGYTDHEIDPDVDAESDGRSLFEPLQIACRSRLVSLAVPAVDTLGKLFAYNYWNSWVDTQSDAASLTAGAVATSTIPEDSKSEDFGEDNKNNGSLPTLAIHAICEAITAVSSISNSAATHVDDDKLQLQIVKALAAAILTSIPSSIKLALVSNLLHGQPLQRAIRTTFNIFLLAKNPSTQIVAQASLTQMIHAVFQRIPKEMQPFGSLNFATDVAEEENGEETVAYFDINVKDLFTVLKALCKLSIKPIPAGEGSADLKSTPMRSKLLSLHLIHTILCSHIHIFFLNAPTLFASQIPALFNELSSSALAQTVTVYTPTLFIHAIKPYLLLSLSRNSVSVVPQVFDVSMEIFGRILIELRVFLKREISAIFTEIILPILESKSSLVTFHQRTSLLKILTSIFSTNNSGGRLLVEIYLNYDCDLESTTTRENIWERFVTLLSRLVTLHNNTKDSQQQLTNATASTTIDATKHSIIRPMTTQALTSYTKEQLKELYSTNGDFSDLKKRGVEVLVKGVLEPLVEWGWEKWKLESDEGAAAAENAKILMQSVDGLAISEETSSSTLELEDTGRSGTRNSVTTASFDDPTQFETLRLKKQSLLEGIKSFNEKPKKGMQLLLNNHSILSRTPHDIASFLLSTEGLNKSMIGEFLGEGIDENISIMHAFVDLQDFTNVPFVAALRTFLQSFRLPGEAQKIDRFMLKFAERFVLQNPNQFSSADTAYVLAYSVIMLNTDQHNSQVKKKMTVEDFLKNNKGIDGESDLPEDFLKGIYEEIRIDEIVLKDEKPGGTLTTENVSERVKFERAAADMALKTEERLKAGIHRARSSQQPDEESTAFGNSGIFYSATHYEHVKNMFEVIWMSVFTALSAFLQEAEDLDSILLALQGFRYSITIACMFEMDLERKAFLSTLGKFALISGNADVKLKTMEAVNAMLEIPRLLGGRLGDGWTEVVVCISNLEKLQTVDG
ncbi:guanine nucleotide exchange protein for ADP-robosylation factor, partial [Physocladia obscura]